MRFGTIMRKGAHRLHQRIAINESLPFAEIFRRPFQNVREIQLRCNAEDV